MKRRRLHRTHPKKNHRVTPTDVLRTSRCPIILQLTTTCYFLLNVYAKDKCETGGKPNTKKKSRHSATSTFLPSRALVSVMRRPEHSLPATTCNLTLHIRRRPPPPRTIDKPHNIRQLVLHGYLNRCPSFDHSHPSEIPQSHVLTGSDTQTPPACTSAHKVRLYLCVVVDDDQDNYNKQLIWYR